MENVNILQDTINKLMEKAQTTTKNLGTLNFVDELKKKTDKITKRSKRNEERISHICQVVDKIEANLKYQRAKEILREFCKLNPHDIHKPLKNLKEFQEKTKQPSQHSGLKTIIRFMVRGYFPLDMISNDKLIPDLVSATNHCIETAVKIKINYEEYMCDMPRDEIEKYVTAYIKERSNFEKKEKTKKKQNKKNISKNK
eukprot:gb/GECH01010839.1/.p1 GENE.gb/GECH01010839.1/~~gb/GECH01010839.1/.p1  ORF type:complete len:199 (+),score=28.13 gb/GECH01010839.1/:1-597(+)